MVERGTYLQLVNKIDDFLNSIRKSAEGLDVSERQKALRLIVKEILVGPEKLTIKHSIPAAGLSGRSEIPGYLLRGWSQCATLWSSFGCFIEDPIFHDSCLKHLLNTG